MRDPQLSYSGLVDEVAPGGDVCEVHEIVDVFDRVLVPKGDFSTFSNWTAYHITHSVGPQSVALVIPQNRVEIRGLEFRCDGLGQRQ